MPPGFRGLGWVGKLLEFICAGELCKFCRLVDAQLNFVAELRHFVGGADIYRASLKAQISASELGHDVFSCFAPDQR